ncbi:MAG: helix-turn-helix domain-containing protein [Candidatus Helarchaeota archaeon]
MIAITKLEATMVKELSDTLSEVGFQVSLFETENFSNTSFDIIATREELTLLIKALYYIDKFKSILANELKLIAKLLNGYPFLIGKYTRNGGSEVHPGVIYNRKGIFTMAKETLIEILESNAFPVIMAKKGKFYINLNKDVLKSRRIELNLSLKDLAEKLNISRRAISMYENGEISAKLEVVIKLEEALNISIEELAEPLYVFSIIKDYLNNIELNNYISPIEEDFKKELDEYFQEIGLEMFWTNKTVFDGISFEKQYLRELHPAIQKNLIITGIKSESDKNFEFKINKIENVSRVLKALSMLIVDDPIERRPNIPMLSIKDLKKIHNTKELIKKLYRQLNF